MTTQPTDDLTALRQRVAELERTLRRCCTNAVDSTGHLKKDLPALEAAMAVEPDKADDFVNDRVCEYQCRIAQLEQRAERAERAMERVRSLAEEWEACPVPADLSRVIGYSVLVTAAAHIHAALAEPENPK